jgi:hypothetical protein
VSVDRLADSDFNLGSLPSSLAIRLGEVSLLRVATTAALKRGFKSKRGTGFEASAKALISAKLCPLPLKKPSVCSGSALAVKKPSGTVWNLGSARYMPA